MPGKNKEKQTNIKYNPALDKFKDKDIFPLKTQAAREHLSRRDIKKEIEAIRVNEKMTKPYPLFSSQLNR